ncbi:hypothetical protein, partial [Marinifilum sp. D714]|uniref:hypothetical protein n=1 Tax=Marinifilum sp. D714 TaxID=2937523 RepID=UPI0027BDB2C7
KRSKKDQGNRIPFAIPKQSFVSNRVRLAAPDKSFSLGYLRDFSLFGYKAKRLMTKRNNKRVNVKRDVLT